MSLIDFIYMGGAVRRFHTLPIHKDDTVSQHSFGVAWFCWLLTSKRPSAGLLMAALAHDLAEQHTGDIPAPAKRALGIKEQFDTFEDEVLLANGMLNFNDALTMADKRTLKIADCMDGAMRCIHEVRMGNEFMRKPLQRFISYIEEMKPLALERIILDEIFTLMLEE